MKLSKQELSALAQTAVESGKAIQKLPMRKSRIGAKRWWTITTKTEKTNINELLEKQKKKASKK